MTVPTRCIRQIPVGLHVFVAEVGVSDCASVKKIHVDVLPDVPAHGLGRGGSAMNSFAFFGFGR